MPDPGETLKATIELVKRGFCGAALRPTPIRCSASSWRGGRRRGDAARRSIGSNRGLESRAFFEIIIAQSRVPVVVDAGLGAPSHAAAAARNGRGCRPHQYGDRRAADPVAMATAFRHGVIAGRLGYEAGLSGAAAGSGPAEARATSPLTAFLAATSS